MNYSISSGGGPADLTAEQAGEGDYTSNIPPSYEFRAGESASHKFTVTAIDGDDYEPNEYFTVTATGTYEDGDSSAEFSEIVVVRIKENDERYLTLSPVSDSALVAHPEFMAKEGATGNENQLTISLNAALPYDLNIGYDVGDDPHTTAAMSDFMMAGGTLTIPDGQTSVTIDIDIIDDMLVEPTEYFTLDFGIIKKEEDPGNALGTFNSINFQESKVNSQPLSVSIMDDDTAETGGFVYLRGEEGGGIPGFPSTRATLTEGQSKTITAEIAGAAPTSDIHIPLKFLHFPTGEATPADYSIDKSITIKRGKKSGSVTLKITDDTDDERYRELLVVEIDGDPTKFPSGYTKGEDRNKYEVIMLDNDKTPASLDMLSRSALTEAAGARTATFRLRIDRRPKATPAGAPPFTGEGADTNEVDAKLVLGYMGTATRGTDYTLIPNNDIVIRKDPAGPPRDCSLVGEAVTCTVKLTVIDDILYESVPGTTESVRINLDTENSSFSGGLKKPTGLSLTIQDDDEQPMFSIADKPGPENGNLTFTVTRTGALGNDVSVTAKTGSNASASVENRATEGTDYAEKTGTLRFRSNVKEQTFEVAITDDNIDEPDETFAVKLSNPADNQGLPKPAIKSDGKTAVGTITDNDDAPSELTISVDTDTIAEAAGLTMVRVTATIDSPTRFATDQTVTVTVGKDGDGAVEGTDYAEVANPIEITIPATEASGTGTFDLTPVNDRIDDDDEKISVEGALAGMTVTHDAITIVDDDERGITVDPVTLTINEADDTSTSEKEENEGTYEVALASQPEGGTVTINITNPGPTVATAEPSNLMFTADNWESAQVVTMIAKDDTIDDAGDQKTTTITHTVSADGTDYAGEEVDDVTVTVLDDDEAPTALTITVDTDTDTDDDQNTISEGAATPTVRITATLDGETQFATDKTITITVGDSDKDSATEGTGGDYNTVDQYDITLPAGKDSVSHDLALTLNSNDGDEPDETVTVTGELTGVTVKGTTITIQDNDATPTVTLVLTPASINESGATSASTVKATMDGESSEAVTLTVSATPVDPAVAGDLTLSANTTLTVPANTQASNGVVTIAAVDNDVDAADKTVTVSATATGGNALVQAPGNQTLTITDDDTRGITVSKATLTLDEEDNSATMDADEHQGTYTVVLDSEPSGGTVTIGVASRDTTIAGVAPATLTFTASNWDEPQTVTATAVLDGIDNVMDRRETTIDHTVTATGTDYDGAPASAVKVTVNDDDGPSTLSINSPSVTETDSGVTATLTFTVQLKPESDKQVTVDYADADAGTATSGGTDYETLAGGTLTFAAGDTSKSVEVTVKGDDIDEPDETVVVRLTSPSNATLTGGETTLDGTGTINDNDPTPTVSVADAMAVSEGNVAAPDPPNNMRFVVTLSAASGQKVTVPYTLSGTATAGTDYTEPDPRSVTIAAGTTQANIDIAVAGDEVDEENETITVTLGTPTNATVSTAEGAGAATGTITDDDTRGVSVTPTALTVGEADNTGTSPAREDQETYKMVLTSQPTGAVTVNLKSGDESVARIDPASLVFDADDWSTERTVIVTGQADVIDNTDDMRMVDISHTVSAAGTDYASETAKSVTVTVTDDDAAPSGITLTASPDSVTENGGAKTITVTAAVNGATRFAEARTVSVSVGGGTAVSDTDYTAVVSFDITIGAGEDDASNTFTLTPTNDVLAEGNETIGVTGTLSGVTITSDEITLTDDDAAPSGITLTVDTNGATAGTPSTVAEDAGATVVTVTATVNGTTRYVDAKTVAVNVADGTAASPADYAEVSNFDITIAAGADSQTGSFTVTPVDDDLDEANETIDVTGTLTDITVTAATVTLTDNDDPVSFSIADAEATEGGKVTFTVSRKGAGDNVASVKVATATDSGDGVNAADADDYTAIATAQTLNFAKGITSQMVEVQTTQDDLFEPDETFKAVLSDPALGTGDPGTGVSIETGKGTAIGTIKNDDTKPSFAVADASATEGSAITFTVTRSGAMDNAVSVKWNTKADSSDGAKAASATDYTPMTTATKLDFAKGVGSQTFTVATTEDVLHEGNETFLVELTGAEGGMISTAQATGTITDDDAAPSGITLTVDTNGATAGTPSTVAEDAGATVVTVTATVNGTTRYVDAKTVAVNVADGTAASPADYAEVSNFDITIAAGADSQTGSFTVTPVDDDLDEANETIDVTGTLTDITVTAATVTLTDNDDPVSFSIADAEATEGGKVTFTVSRKGAGDNVASVKVATATDSGDGVNAADADDYTAIATAQTLNFAKGITSQMVEVQTTQDDLFEPDETFKAVLSDPALGTGDPGTGVSIETGKGTAIGTIKNDDTKPSFAVADASATEGSAITFTVTRSGAMDNAVSVKWNTKADSSDGAKAASATDYTPMTTATKLDFAKGVGSQTFTVATTEDVLHEGNETFLVELTGAEGGMISTAQATGTITDDDAAPSGITLTVDTNGATAGTPSTVAEDAGATVVTVTATVNGTTRYVDAKTVAVNVADGTAASPADYAEVSNFDITIAAGADSQTGSFTVTPVDDDLDEANETIDVTGTLTDITVTAATVTLTDNDDPVSFSIADAEATEGGKVTFTVSRKGAGDNVASVKVATATDSGDGVNAADADDYTAIATAQTLNFAKGITSQMVEVQTTQDDLFEPDETFKAVLSDPALGTGDPGTGVSIETGKGTAIGTIKNDDTKPSFAVADASATEGSAITFTVTRSGAMDNAVSVKWNTKADSSDGAKAASATDYTPMTTATKLDFAKGVGSQTFTVATTEDVLHEGNETFLVELTGAEGGMISTAQATGTITDDDAAPSGITLTVDTNGATAGTPSTVAEDAGATVVTVTATVNGTTRYVDAKTVAVNVADGTAASPADYAEVSNFDITIAAGADSQTGSFTVTPVDDDLDEANETIDVTGTLTDITVTAATVTLTDNDDPVSFSIADAEATEGGKVTFTVSRKGAGDNVASVKVATATDSGDGVNAADADDYTAIATAQTLNFAKGITSQMVEVQTTQDDLFEPDETFKAVLSDPALGTGDPGTGVSIETGKGTAIGTIKNDDTKPSFAVADASATEGSAITFTVTRSGAMDNAVSVKWNTKADSSDGAKAASATDYTPMTTATKLDFAKGVGSQTFTVATTEDVLHEGNETFLVELTGAEGGMISTAQATGTITDDDAAPSGITLTVDTNGATAGTPSTVAEDAGATVVTVTATVNGTTRYVDAKTVAVNVADGTAASPADYAEVSNFDITIAAGADSQTGSFTVTPVDDDLDEANETIDVTGTLTDITVTAATVTLTDNDDPVSFSIADAEATEGGKVTFTVSRKGAGDNVASVKVATATDSGDGVNAADADDYTAIATAQTLNFAKGITSQMVEVQTTQDDLFEPDETFKAVLSDPALGTGDPGTGVSIETGKGTAIGTIKNDDTKPSFAVADASATEGSAITFTVTRSGAMDNAVSVKWNTKADSSDGAKAASATDYTPMTTATKLDFAKGVGSQTFTVATTEDVLHEGNETFLVELTGAEGGMISTAQATGTITDDDAAPGAITISVDTDTGTAGDQTTIAEGGGAKTVRVTATITDTTRFVDAKTVTLEVGADADSATEETDYAEVTRKSITIDAGAASGYVEFTLTPTQDTLHEGSETISLDGTLIGVTVTDATITLTDDDGEPTALTLTVDADTGTNNVQTSLAENGGAKTVRVTATLDGSSTFTEAKTVTLEVGADADSAEEGADYAEVTRKSINIDAGSSSGYVEFTLTPTDDTRHETSETISLDGTLDGVTVTDASLTITDNDAAPTTLTLTVDADDDTENVQSSLAENGGAKTVRVTATFGGATQFDEDKTLTLIVGDDDDTATEGTDYADYANITLTIPAGDTDVEHTFTLTPTDDAFHEESETISFDATLASVTVTGASITLTSDDAAPAITLTVDADKDTDNMQTSLAEDGGAKTVRATATLDGTTRLEAAADLTLAVGKDTDSAVEGTDYTTVDDRTITIGAGVASVIHDFTLTPTDDDIDEPNEGISIEGTLTGITVTGTAITLTDDEVTPTASLVLTPTAIDESGDDNASAVTAMLSGKSNEAVTLTVAAAAGADTASGDFTLSGTTLTIAAGATTSTGTVTITAVDNDVDAPNKSVTVSATASGGGVANPTDQTLTITDDEGVPTASLVLTPTAIDESGDDNASAVTAMLSGKSNEAVTLTVAAAAGADTASGDFTLSGTTLTIAAGATTSTGTVTITAVDNDVDAPNKSVTVSATASGGGVANPTDQTLTITDDEGVPTASLVLTPTAIDESGDDNASAVTAMLSGKSNEAVTLTVAAAAGADTASGDFTLSGTTLTIAAGATTSTGTVTITAVDNDVDAPNKSVTVSATASGGGVANPTDQTLTITDDEGVPTASLVLTPTAIDESGDDNASAVTAMLSGKSNEAVTLTVAAAAGADTASGDFTLSGTTLTIAAGATTSTGTVTITAVDNDVDAPNKSVTVSATASGGGVANPTDQTLTITDDEGVPTASLVLTPTAIDESGDDNASAVTAMLSGKSNEAVTLTVAAAAGADTASGDFTLSGTTLTIAAGATTSTGTVTITAVDNDVDAPNKSVTVSATASGGGVANPTDQTLTITDDEGVPTASLVLTPTAIDESGDDNASAVTAMLSGKSNEAVTLTVAAAAGADTASGDFTLSGTTLTIAAGATTSTGTVTITAVDNDVDAPNKSVTVSATASGGGVANPTDQTLTITDDEGVPTASLVLTPTAIDESGDDNASAVTAMLSGKSNEAVTLTVAAAAGADTASGDFTLSGTTLTIAAGATTSTGTVTITAVDNDVDAPNKSVTVSATASGGGVANPTDQTLTITDDEGVPTASLVLTPTAIDESGDDNASAVTAMLSGKSNEAVTLTVAAAAGADTASGDFTLSGTTLTIAAGATTSTGTVTITAVDNDVDAPNKSVTVSATASGGGVANPTDQTLTITDDEGVPTASLVLTPTAIDESGDDNASAVTAMLSGKSNEAVTLTVAAAAGADTASGDFTLSGTTLTIAAGATTSTGTVTITAVDNDVDAPNKSVTVSATASGGGVANPTDQTLTITDDEGVPTASLVLTPTAIDESGDDNASAVTAMLSGKSNEAVTLTVAAAAGADTASGDFTLSGTTLTIAAGATTSTGTVTITAVDNDVDAPNKSVTVSATASGGGVANPTDQTLTITDDEGVPTASLVLTPTAIDESGDDNASAVTAMLSGKSNEAVTLTVAAAAGADTASGDFTLSGTTLTIAAGATTSTGTVTITAVDNDVDAPNKSVTVSATASGGGVANPTDQTLTITDDEGVPTASLVLTPTAIDESGDDNASAVTAMLSGKSNEAVTLTVAAAAGADTASGDFTLSGTTLTIAAGATTSTGTVTITAVDNDVDAPNKSVTVSATASGGGVANPTDQTLTITDDEGVPTASLVLTPTAIDESGDDNASAVTAMLSGKSNEAVTLTVAAAAGADTASGDFTLSGTTLTIAAGATTSTGTVTITAVDNDVDAPNKSVTVSATASGGGVANPTDQTLTITDDEGVPTASLVLTPTAIDESGDDNASAVTAMLSGKSNEAVTLTVAAAAGADTASGDFTLSGTTLTIAAGATTSTGTVTITAVDNDVDAPNKSVTVSATASGGGVANPTDQTLTITDDDAVPTGITLTVLPVTVGEGAGETEITVTATVNGSTRYEDAKTVTVSVGGGTAISGTDYDAVSDFDITIAAGAASKTGTFDLTPTDDVLHEEDETIDVTGASGSLTITKASITITDDDAEPSFAVADASASEGDAIIFTVTRSGAMDNAVSVKWNTKPATGPGAASATDYTPVTTARTLTFAKGVSSQTFTVATTEDDLHEGDETFLVELTDAIGGTITTAEATGTITDDEVTPTVTLVLTPGTINESGNGNASTVTATLTGKSSAAVTLTVAAAAGAHTVAGDFTLSANKTLMIAAGATTSTGTVTITAVDNDVDAPNKSVTVSATASGGGGVSGVAKPDSQILTITDDDDVAPTVTLMLAPTTINESGSTNSSTVTATLSGESSAAVTVTVAAAAGAGTAAGDFTVSSNKTLTIAAGAKTSTGAVTITAVDNDVDAPNKSVTVSATASGGGVADPGNQTLTITDDDVAPTGITLSVSPATVGEGDGETEITVTATVNGTTRYVDAKTVTVSVGGGDAISGTDYTAVPSFDIIIAAGEASKAGTFDLTPTDDVVHEGTEMIDVTGASGSLTITKASITLTDDDAAPMALTLSVDADMGTPGIQTSLAEDGGAKKVRVTAMLGGSSTFTEAKTVTLEVGADADSATEGTDYAEVERQSININAGAESGYVEFTLTPTQDVLHEGSEAISLDGTLTGVTVTDSKIMLNDDDGAPTALTLSVDADTGTDGTQTTIAEDGGAKTVRVTATITGETRFVEIKTVTLEVGADADSATEGTDYAEVMRRSITINAGAESGYEEFTLTPTDDTRHEGSETISLAGTLTDVAVTGTSLTITDEEDTPTVTLVLTPATISESGSTNASTVTATLSGESSSAVTVTVAAAAGAGTAAGDFTVSTNKTLTIAAGATTSTGAVTITAVDNNVDAPNKSVTVSATASGGGVASPADQTLTITDDDAAPTGITLSVSPATVGEGDGETEITVTATVNGSTRYVDAKTVTVSVGGGTAISGTDYDAVPSFDITIAAGDASKAGTFDLEPTDDAVHEENETIDVTGSSGVLDITKASIIITDNDDRSDPMLAAWLGRFGRGVAEQALDGIAGRIAASRSAGMQGTVAGKALALGNPGPTPWNFGAGRSFGYAARSDPTISFDADSGSNPSNPVAMTAREVLLGSSFTATGETATGGSLALWGRTAQSSFDGQDGAFSLDGETTSAMLGADYARDGWLLGLALMHSSGKGGYSDSQARPCPAGTAGQSPCGETVRQGGGTVKATMTAVLPYASLQVSERLRLWGALGHGSGEVTLRPEPGGTLSADISWSMAATGLRGDVITAGQGSNFSLAFTSDMLWSRTRSEKTHELAASSATVTRLRAGLEAGWQMPLEHGSWLTPRLEIGARHDGGDAETGLGVELGGGLAWTDPGRGLSLDLSARSLIVHDDDDIKDQGFAAAFNFDPQPDSARGLSLSLRQVAGGQPEGGLNALFTPEPLSARSGASGSSRSAEAAYGLPALSGRFTFTPLVGLSLAEEARDFRVGWRLTPEATAAPDLSIGLVATRRESAAARPVHGVGLGMTFRW